MHTLLALSVSLGPAIALTLTTRYLTSRKPSRKA